MGRNKLCIKSVWPSHQVEFALVNSRWGTRRWGGGLGKAVSAEHCAGVEELSSIEQLAVLIWRAASVRAYDFAGVLGRHCIECFSPVSSGVPRQNPFVSALEPSRGLAWAHLREAHISKPWQ